MSDNLFQDRKLIIHNDVQESNAYIYGGDLIVFVSTRKIMHRIHVDIQPDT